MDALTIAALREDGEAKDEEIKDLKAALQGLMFSEDMLPNWDSSATDDPNPYDVARKLLE